MAKALAAGVAFLVCSVVADEARASPPRNVKPTLLSRGTYPAFHVKAKTGEIVVNELPVVLDPPLEFMARAYQKIDIVVREHRYGAQSENGGLNSHTGWHKHPGPVFITVVEGELTIFEWDDVTCSIPIVVKEGQGYVDTGHGHIAINSNVEAPAVDVTVITAPMGADKPFREEIQFRDNEEALERPHCKEWMDTIHTTPTTDPPDGGN